MRSPTGPHSQTMVHGAAPAAMKRGLAAYFEGINRADYQSAYDAMGRAYHGADSDLSDIAAGWVSSYDFNIEVQSATNRSAWVTFDSIFAMGKGPKKTYTCARWSLDYTFVRDGDRLEINANSAHGGADVAYLRC